MGKGGGGGSGGRGGGGGGGQLRAAGRGGWPGGGVGGKIIVVVEGLESDTGKMRRKTFLGEVAAEFGGGGGGVICWGGGGWAGWGWGGGVRSSDFVCRGFGLVVKGVWSRGGGESRRGAVGWGLRVAGGGLGWGGG